MPHDMFGNLIQEGDEVVISGGLVQAVLTSQGLVLVRAKVGEVHATPDACSTYITVDLQFKVWSPTTQVIRVPTPTATTPTPATA